MLVTDGSEGLARRVGSQPIAVGSDDSQRTVTQGIYDKLAQRECGRVKAARHACAVLNRRYPRSHVVRVVCSYEEVRGPGRLHHERVLVVRRLERRGFPHLYDRRAEHAASWFHGFRRRIKLQHIPTDSFYQSQPRLLPRMHDVRIVLQHHRTNDSLFPTFHHNFRQFGLGVFVLAVFAMGQFDLVALLLVEETLALFKPLEG